MRQRHTSTQQRPGRYDMPSESPTWIRETTELIIASDREILECDQSGRGFNGRSTSLHQNAKKAHYHPPLATAVSHPRRLNVEPLSMSFQHPAPSQTRTGGQVTTRYPFTAFTPPSFPGRRGTSIFIDCRSEGSLTVDNSGRRWTGRDIHSRCRRKLITFDMLPDDILLEIFDFYLGGDLYGKEWIKLAHVCRRWRSVVFQSPRRLDLRLVCTPRTPARDTLDIWPPLPLIIRDFDKYFRVDESRSSVDNVIAALEHNDRVCQINLVNLTNSHYGCLTDSAAMQKPFPELTDLHLSMGLILPGLILPDSFLGGTATRLRSLIFSCVTFPGLQKLLLSATHLVHLYLLNIPPSGYIPPEVMATSLESLSLKFRYPQPRPALETRRPPPLTRSILPSLARIEFRGASEYLEEILARIDAPRLDKLDVTFFNQIIFDTPQLFQFISRRPTLRAPERGYITFAFGSVSVSVSSACKSYARHQIGSFRPLSRSALRPYLPFPRWKTST